MMSIAALAGDSNDMKILVLMLAACIALALWRFAHWLMTAPPEPEPWDEQVTAELDEAVPICCRCLERHSPDLHFCPECGAPVGTYTNLLPFEYLFSLGDLLRIGTTGIIHRTPFTVLGFIAVSLVEYTIFAPLYWFMLLRNIERLRLSGQTSSEAGSGQI